MQRNFSDKQKEDQRLVHSSNQKTYAEVTKANRVEGKESNLPVHKEKKNSDHWVQKEKEVLEIDWDNMMLVSKCCAHDN